MITVDYTPRGTAGSVRIAISEKHDGLDVLACAFRHLVPNADPKAPDPRWDALQARLRAEATPQKAKARK